MTITLASPLTLLRTSRYASPGDPAEILPEVYGDFSSGGLAGPIPARLINKAGFVYAAAAHAVGSIANVYDGEVEKTIGVDVAVSVSNNYESQGVIATLDFVAQPVGPVSWRGTGKQSGGVTVTNPVTQLEDLLSTRGGAVAADYETAALELARATASTKGYQTAWVVADDRPVAEWLSEWMLNVMGSWHKHGDGRLCLWVDDGNWPLPEDIVAHVVARRDCVDGDDGVTMTGSERDLVNALNVHYLYSWTLGQPSSRITSEEDLISKNAHGESRKGVTLKGHRRTADVTTWATVLFERQAYRRRVEGAVLRFTTTGAKLLHATIGDSIGFSWPWGPVREEGNDYVNEILRIIGLRHDVGGSGQTEVTAVDLGGYLTSDTYFDADDGGSLGDGYFNADDFYGAGRDLAVRV